MEFMTGSHLEAVRLFSIRSVSILSAQNWRINSSLIDVKEFGLIPVTKALGIQEYNNFLVQ
ncbi:hypothetical protein GCM10022277_21310 [Litoribacillus peritrichatus]|uniref:Uncharacterized protein n=1 Tax=Litoribacillus peritrichatus TaxID=718191 RepID=A0ABP7MND8_9GAMM